MNMKIIFTRIFVGLGVIFLALILISAYFFVTDPYNLKPLIFGSDPVSTNIQDTTNTPNSTGGTSQTSTASGGFVLSPAQKQALVSFGVDPETVPTSISSEQETCFTEVLGASRVAEIKAGAVPSALEFFRAKACI